MKKFLPLLFVALCSMSQGQVVDKNYDGAKGSLFSDSSANPLLDRTARREGDLITIIISEQSVATFKAQTNTEKQDSNGINVNLFNNVLERLIRPWTTSDNASQKGGGDSSQNSKLEARLTGVVKKVLPSGNMEIEGVRTLTVNRELQSFVLSGTIRRDDVRSDNTIMSENIANAQIKLQGKGAIYDRTRRGLITQVLDWLF